MGVGSRQSDDYGRGGPRLTSRRHDRAAHDNDCGRFSHFTCYSLVPAPRILFHRSRGAAKAGGRTRAWRPRVLSWSIFFTVRSPLSERREDGGERPAEKLGLV